MDKCLLPDIDAPHDGIYAVYSLCFARVERRVHDNFIRRDMHDGPMPLDYNLWILHNAYRTVLVDTGFGNRAASERGRQLDLDPVEALGRVGIDVDAIEDIIITHLHYDHAGNIDRFSKACFHVQDAEVAFATGRCMGESEIRYPFDVEDVVAFVRHTYAERVRFHDGDAILLPGISVHAVPGHTLGVQAVKVMTPRGVVVLASDSSHYYANFLRRAPFVVTVDAMATLRSYDRLQDLAGAVERIVPGHDPKVRELYPNYDFGGVQLTALHEEPKLHDIVALTRFPEAD